MVTSKNPQDWIFPVALLLVAAVLSARAASGQPVRAGTCNLYQGKWVFNSSNLLYDSSTCPFIDPEFDCIKYGRPDKAFLNYTWKPDSCNLPRFDGLDFVKRWRGKKIMLVGDSLSLNQWVSLVCMIHSAVPNATYDYGRGETLSSVTFQDYGVNISYYRSPYLVDIKDEPAGPVLDLGSIKDGDNWKGMDMLAFGSGHWWAHSGTLQSWKFIRYKGTLYQDMNRNLAFYEGMTTWARWVNLTIDPNKTKVFFQGISPTHYQSSDWNSSSPPSKGCFGEQNPFSGSKYPAGTPLQALVIDKVFSRIKKPVTLLNITALSQLRIDAHPSIYSGAHQGKLDCSHWCLPGLPDTWNQLLYTFLLQSDS